MKIIMPSAENQALTQQKEIARMLGISDDILATRVAKNNADPNMTRGFVSLQINRTDGTLNARSESFQPIPEGIAAKPKTLTKDPVSARTSVFQVD
jgi:hypothetical protein